MCSFAGRAALVLAIILAASVPPLAEAGDADVARINNAAPRRDADGNVLDAHDGCLCKFGGRHYLFGTAYGKADGFGKTNRYRCYSSPDLVRWTLEGDSASGTSSTTCS